MNAAKTNAERQADLKARRTAAGLVALRNVWVHPDDVPAMREHAAKLARKRSKVGRPRKSAGVLVLIRGLPGSGKSTSARSMHGFEHFEADMFFERGGSYSFDPAQLPAAHAWCLQRASDALQEGKAVVVSNTFTRSWEMAPYIDAAERYGASVQIIEAKGGWPNVHGVPESAIQRMIDRWEEVGPDGRPRKATIDILSPVDPCAPG